MRLGRSKEGGIAFAETDGFVAQEQVDFALHDKNEFIADVDDLSVGAAPGGDVMEVYLKQFAVALPRQELELNAVAAPDERCAKNRAVLGSHDAGWSSLILGRKGSDVHPERHRNAMQAVQRRPGSTVLQFGEEAHRAVAVLRDIGERAPELLADRPDDAAGILGIILRHFCASQVRQ